MADQHRQIQAMAAKELAGHIVRRDRGFTWLASSAKDAFHRFRVTWAPGAVVVTGQLGEIVYRGPNAFWEGPWDAARFIAKCNFDYLTGKSSTALVFDRDASVRGLIRNADDQLRYGDRELWEAICKRYSDTWASDYREFNPAKVTDQMRAAKLLREDGELSEGDIYRIAGTGEAVYYSYPPDARWQYEAVLLWAKAVAEAEPLHSKAARQRRKFRDWRRSLKSRPPLFRPERFTGPPASHYGGLLYWRRTPSGAWRLLAPFRLLGGDLSGLGLWREQGSQMPASCDDRFTPVSGGARG